MFCPLPPMPTGVATYSLRVLQHTCGSIDWTVLHAPGSDPAVLPDGVRAVPIDLADSIRLPSRRFFMLGNSPECFGVAAALRRFGGCGVFHETVMHHMLRHCLLERGLEGEYRRELEFEYGPSAARIGRLLSSSLPGAEYDALLKRFPLTGRLLHACTSLACLNRASAGTLSERCPSKKVTVIGHPLDDLPSGPPVSRSLPGPPHEIGMIGGAHPGRNHDVLLSAVEILRGRGMDVRAVFVGGGWPGDPAGRAEATGRLEDDAYAARIAGLSVAVDVRHPSCDETSGSLLEAMKAGVPCVTSTSGSFAFLPSDSVLRIPSPPSPAALARALELVLGDGDLARSLGMAGAVHAISEGSPRRTLADWTGLVGETPEVAPAPERTSMAVSAAWDDAPEGAGRVLDQGPVAWRTDGRLVLEAPAGSGRALVTAWGGCTVDGSRSGSSPRVFETAGDVTIEGSGFVSQVSWLEER